LPVTTAVGCWLCQSANKRGTVLAGLSVMAVLFASGLILCASNAVDPEKAPRSLTAGACRPDEEIRTGAFGYFQPSLVFYCQREVTHLETEAQTRDFLSSPLPTYVFVPELLWQTVKVNMPAGCHIVDSHYELYRRCHVVVVANQ
jgi:hypothetical protein